MLRLRLEVVFTTLCVFSCLLYEGHLADNGTTKSEPAPTTPGPGGRVTFDTRAEKPVNGTKDKANPSKTTVNGTVSKDASADSTAPTGSTTPGDIPNRAVTVPTSETETTASSDTAAKPAEIPGASKTDTNKTKTNKTAEGGKIDEDSTQMPGDSVEHINGTGNETEGSGVTLVSNETSSVNLTGITAVNTTVTTANDSEKQMAATGTEDTNATSTGVPETTSNESVPLELSSTKTQQPSSSPSSAAGGNDTVVDVVSTTDGGNPSTKTSKPIITPPSPSPDMEGTTADPAKSKKSNAQTTMKTNNSKIQQLALGICVPTILVITVVLGLYCYRRRKKSGRGYITLDDFGTFEGMQNPNYDGEL